MTTPVLKSNINQINIPTQYHKLIEGEKKVCRNKIENIIEVNDDSNDDHNDNDIIHYWHEDLQLTKEDDNIFLDPNG